MQGLAASAGAALPDVAFTLKNSAKLILKKLYLEPRESETQCRKASRQLRNG